MLPRDEESCDEEERVWVRNNRQGRVGACPRPDTCRGAMAGSVVGKRAIKKEIETLLWTFEAAPFLVCFKIAVAWIDRYFEAPYTTHS